jgi:hypothetical protein
MSELRIESAKLKHSVSCLEQQKAFFDKTSQETADNLSQLEDRFNKLEVKG